MKIQHDNIWDYWLKPNHLIGVTTNSCLNKNGDLIMGAGIAKEAKERCPDLPHFLSQTIKDELYIRRENGDYESKDIDVYYGVSHSPYGVIALQTKYDWKDPSPINLVEITLSNLVTFCTWHPKTIVHIPALGCGHGGLDWESQVRPLCENLPDNCIVHLKE